MRRRSSERRASKELVTERPCAASPPAAEEPSPIEGVQDYERLFLMLMVVMFTGVLWSSCLLESTKTPQPPQPPTPPTPPSVGQWLLQLTGRL